MNENKIIAEFMSFSCESEHHFGYLYKINLQNVEVKWLMPEEMKFHESWDWLMPVVEKIEDIGVSTNIHYFAGLKKSGVGMHSMELLGYLTTEFDHSTHKKTKIDAVYQAVVDFIKWYNKQEK